MPTRSMTDSERGYFWGYVWFLRAWNLAFMRLGCDDVKDVHPPQTLSAMRV
jgi:hypothetical protein